MSIIEEVILFHVGKVELNLQVIVLKRMWGKKQKDDNEKKEDGKNIKEKKNYEYKKDINE